MSSTELESAHKKALKALEGEKRAAVKKAKALKGKKGKETLAAVEAEFSSKLQTLEKEYQEKIQSLASDVGSLKLNGDGNDGDADAGQPPADENAATASTDMPSAEDETAAIAARKREKARKKKERQREKDLEREQQIEWETANAGPSHRQIELEQLQTILSPLDLQVSEVEADGHCLYRAVGAQVGQPFKEIRSICANALENHQDELAAFCELTDTVSTFEQYVEQVRNSAEWGGHLELRALSMALDRPIHVYSVQQGKDPLVVHEDQGDSSTPPIRLSYHLHYYALGEHYNQVVPAAKA